ncbi:hypothetical protein MUN84_21090 [Hymenobacter sp. 5516J-16]|uniref:hypothetical protein n=1 Tax=Hymenobacter sp. 5516J-16 TaxID=2932253 RepID=UPI001FD3DDA6|nr:hypothetical protein [Hymenobacter sp. 5516J-16]UOQ76942.1 hypothetical protein MUN84_21090 [Hymenobacter sp. 5516J-16]
MKKSTNSRRRFLHTLGFGLAGSALLTACARASTGAAAAANSYLVYVGTYGPADQDNIWLYRLEPATGALTRVTGPGAEPAPPS